MLQHSLPAPEPRTPVAPRPAPHLAPVPDLAPPAQRRILDFDIENRPSTYRGRDMTSAEITVIAWCWADDPSSMRCCALGQHTMWYMLDSFSRAWDEAGLVTGHYIRGHDMGIINAHLVEARLPLLAPKLSSDTYLDLKKFSGISKSQETLADLLGLEAPKIQMPQMTWRSANRLEPAGIRKAKERCVGDVIQHMELREELIRRDLLKEPKKWKP